MKLVKPWRIMNIQESAQEKEKNNFFRHNSKSSKDGIFFANHAVLNLTSLRPVMQRYKQKNKIKY